MNKAQIAEHFDIALTTLDHWIRRGCPVEARGSKGKDWNLDPDDVQEWRQDRQEGQGDKGRDRLSPLEAAGIITGSIVLLALEAAGLNEKQIMAVAGKIEPELRKIRRDFAGLLGDITRSKGGRE